MSRHLGCCARPGLVAEERAGAFTLVPAAAAESGRPTGRTRTLWAWLQAEFDARHRRRPVPTTRGWRRCGGCGKESFAQHGAGDERRQLVPGRSWAAWSRALGLLLPAVDVADLGCGEGYLTIEAARWARRVIAVDRSRGRARRAQRSWRARRKVTNITWKRGELEQLPLRDASVDVALLSQALHHAERPGGARCRGAPHPAAGRPRCCCSTCASTTSLGARRSSATAGSASPTTSCATLLACGRLRSDVIVRVGARRPGDPFTVLIAAGTRPARRCQDELRRETS